MSPASERDPLENVEWDGSVEPAEPVSKAIHERCTKGLRPKKARSALARLGFSVLLSVGLIALVVAVADSRAPAWAGAAAGAAGWGAVVVGVLLAGLVRPPGRRAQRWLRLAVLLAVPALFLIYLTFLADYRVSLGEFSGGERASHAAWCGLHAFVFGAIVTAGALFLWRRTDPFSPHISGMLLGLFGGVMGASTIGLVCPSGEAWHLFVSHGAMVVVFALIGLAVGRRLLSP